MPPLELLPENYLPIYSLVLTTLVGMIFGGVAGVFLRSDKVDFIVNVLLGIMGAGIGAFVPVLLGSTNTINVAGFDYLIRALAGAFVLVVVGSLFRTAKHA